MHYFKGEGIMGEMFEKAQLRNVKNATVEVETDGKTKTILAISGIETADFKFEIGFVPDVAMSDDTAQYIDDQGWELRITGIYPSIDGDFFIVDGGLFTYNDKLVNDGLFICRVVAKHVQVVKYAIGLEPVVGDPVPPADTQGEANEE